MSRWRVQGLFAVVLLTDMTTMRKGQERTENGQDNATVPEDNGTEKVKEREGVIDVKVDRNGGLFCSTAHSDSFDALVR